MSPCHLFFGKHMNFWLGGTPDRRSQHTGIFVQEKLNEHLQRQKVMWLINESGMEDFLFYIKDEHVHVWGGRGAVFLSQCFSLKHCSWRASWDLYNLVAGPGHSSQSLLQLGRSWPSPSVLEMVMSSREVDGERDRAHESTLASLFSTGETLLPLYCSFGGKGCKWSWTEPVTWKRISLSLF